MKIPLKLNILGIEHSVVFTDNIASEIYKYLDEKEKKDDYVGYFVSEIATIFISSSVPEPVQESTFLHEVLEAITYLLAMECSHNDLKRFETALYQVLTQNKMVK